MKLYACIKSRSNANIGNQKVILKTHDWLNSKVFECDTRLTLVLLQLNNLGENKESHYKTFFLPFLLNISLVRITNNSSKCVASFLK